MAMATPANSPDQSDLYPWLTDSSIRPWVITACFSWPGGGCMSSVGKYHWFHCPSTLKIPMLIRPGRAIGSMTRKNVWVCEAPSTYAASATVLGSVLKNECMKKTVNESDHATYTRMIMGNWFGPSGGNKTPTLVRRLNRRGARQVIR